MGPHSHVVTAARPDERRSAMTGPTNKDEWRRHIRATSVPIPADVATAVQTYLLELLADIPGLVLFYRSMPGEIDLEPVADQLGWQRMVVTRTPDEGPLTIHPAIGAMEQHRYGFAQPVDDAMVIEPHHVSATLVPAMAFDRTGARLGHGRGYYDELLARIPADRPRVGVTTEQFFVDQIPTEPHDIPMTHVVTETGITDFIPDDGW